MNLYECLKCGRAYTEPGPARFCHPTTMVQAVDTELVGKALAEREAAKNRRRQVLERPANREPIYPVQDIEDFPEPEELYPDDGTEDPGCELTKWGDKISTHKSGAKRANDNKLRWDLMPIAPMRDTAMIWTFGAEKYGARNWEKGFNWSGPYASMQRHLQAWFSGEDFDPESGMSHLAHAACNLQMLQQFEYTYREGDDRPKKTCPPVRKMPRVIHDEGPEPENRTRKTNAKNTTKPSENKTLGEEFVESRSPRW